MLNWANRFNICCFLDNHGYTHTRYRYGCLLAADAVEQWLIPRSPGDTAALRQLRNFLQQQNDWLFGHFNFDFITGNAQVTALPDYAGFPDACLFRPRVVIELLQQEVRISSLGLSPESVYEAISGQLPARAAAPAQAPVFTPRIDKTAYLAKIAALRQHILKGDCYEINFCQEFYAAHTAIQPLETYLRLTALSPAPFAAFYKLNQHHLLCASPERYVCREGDTLFSQPIKGTAGRDTANPANDDKLKQQLLASAKDRSENVMIVDLVRNDLSKICVPGSVKVDELFGLYSFPQVHQLISTISGTLQPDLNFADVLEATFPMGSMTGAPKKRVLELTSRYETVKRGIYAGTVGYINPQRQFDFNVVIRSLLYNAQSQYLSYLVGGGITFYSDAAQEYEECLLKAAGIKKALQ